MSELRALLLGLGSLEGRAGKVPSAFALENAKRSLLAIIRPNYQNSSTDGIHDGPGGHRELLPRLAFRSRKEPAIQSARSLIYCFARPTFFRFRVRRTGSG